MLRFIRIFNSIKFRYLLLVAVAITTLAIAGNFVVRKLSDEAFRSAGEYTVGNLDSVAVNIDEIMKNVEFVFTPLISDARFVELVQNLQFLNPVETYDDYDKMQQLNNIFLKSYISNNYVDSFYLYNKKDDIALSAKTEFRKISDVSIRSTEWYGNFFRLGGKAGWTASKAIGSGEKLMCSYRVVKDPKDLQPNVIISININCSLISKIISKISFKGSGYAFVTDPLGNVAVSSKAGVDKALVREAAEAIGRDRTEGYFRTTLSGQPCLLAFHISNESGLKYIAVIPVTDINSFTPIVMRYIIYIYIALIGMLALLAAITYTGFYRPVQRLFSGMRRLESGDFKVRLDSRRRDEFGYIYNHFNDMVKNLKQLIDENYIIQLSKKDAQLKMVLSQINEHFFYNTLDCIHWLAQKYNANEISDIILSLSQFYSLSLSSGRDVIRVREIAAIVESYMHIQQVRNPDRYKYSCTVDPALEGTMALKYLFQPLVENAVIHGMEDVQENGRIEVVFARNNGLLHFEVRDNGKGMSPQKLREIMQSLDRIATGSDVAFALANINSQIKLFYGEDYQLSIESAEGSGTRIWMDIPVIEEGDENAQADNH